MAERLDIIVRIRNAAQAGVRSVKKGLAGIGSTASATTGAIRGLYAQLAAVTALFAGGALLGGSIKTFSQFDDIMRQAGAVTNATKEEMIAMTEQAQIMGKTTRFTASNAAEGLRLLGMAGFEASESIEALPGVLSLAAAGSLELGNAADIATNVLAAFGLEVENLERVNGDLVKTFTSSNTTLIEIGESFKLVGPIAKGVGANFEDLLASIGKLGDAGLKGTLAGTALRGAINALFNPTREEAKLMDDLSRRIGGVGLQIKDANGDFVGFIKIIEQLEKAGLKGEEALKLFGQRAGPGMAALLQAGSRAINQLKTDIDESGGVADDVARQMEAGLGGAGREAAAAFEAIKIAIGEAFSEDIIDAVRSARDTMLQFVDKIKELKRDGVLDAYAQAVKISFKVIAQAARLAFAQINEVVRILVAVSSAYTGDLDVAKEAVKEIGSDYRKLLQERGLIASDLTLEANSIEKSIELVKKQIDITKDKIKQNEDDINGWRGRIAGVSTYQKQLEKYQSKLYKLQANLKYLENRKHDVELRIKVEDFDSIADSFDKIGSDIENESGPIGKGTQRVKKAITNSITPDASSEAILKSGLVRLRAILQNEAVILEGKYDQRLISLDKYFNERAKLIERRIAGEVEVLRGSLETEEDVNKREIINAKIFAKQQQLAAALSKLENDRYRETERLEKNRISDQEELNRLRLRSEKALSDQKARLAVAGQGSGFEGQFQKELSDLQIRQNQELNQIQQYHNKVLELLRKRKAAEEEIEAASQQKKAALKEQEQLQSIEKSKLLAEQENKVREQQLVNIGKVASETGKIVTAVYELTGRKNKELFYLSKGIAIAEATINLQLAISKALSQKGAFGLGDAVAILAAGGKLLATIGSQSLAEGGPIRGYSPNPKADNIKINATAGEFMQPISSVKKAGMDAMEVIRRGEFNPGLLRSALGLKGNMSMPIVSSGNGYYAEGGAISSSLQRGFIADSIKVELENRSGTDLEASEGDARYDSDLRRFIIGVVIDARNRNVGGINR